jgi:hypothetical protein
MKENIDNWDFVIYDKEHFIDVRNKYKTLREYENQLRKENACIKENDIVTFFLLYEGKEILLNNETYEKLFTK